MSTEKKQLTQEELMVQTPGPQLVILLADF